MAISNAVWKRFKDVFSDVSGKPAFDVKVVSSTSTITSEYLEDSAHTDGDMGQFVLAVRKDNPTNLSDTDGDYEALQVSGGKLWTAPVDLITTTGGSVLDDTLDTVKVSQATHDNLNANANIQVNNTDVGASNPVHVTDATGSEDISVALEASAVVKASAGTLIEVIVTNTSASAQYIQVHDSTTVPADTTVPLTTFLVGASQTVSYVPKGGLTCGTGITLCNSSTAATKTIGAADCWFDVRYV